MKAFTGICFLAFLVASCDIQLGPGAQQAENQYVAYITPDDLADRMINDDPSLVLVDIRPEAAFQAFAIPGFINMPLATWPEQKEEIEKMFRGKGSVVLADEKGIGARFASAYLQENKICESIILEGGVEGFVRTIFQKPADDIALDDGALEQQRFREAAAMYFVGLSKPIEPEPYTSPAPAKKKIVKVAPKKKIQQDEEEGC